MESTIAKVRLFSIEYIISNISYPTMMEVLARQIYLFKQTKPKVSVNQFIIRLMTFADFILAEDM